MSWLYGRIIRPLLFTQDAEHAHERTMRTLAWVSRNELVCDAVESVFGSSALPVDLFGLRFPNPIGLAAGMDKFADAVPAWAALGFGFSELGGVTWLAQPGNPQPRLFRVIPEEAIVNRMGFNNPGAEALAQKLAAWRTLGRWPNHPVGINLGKSKVTPLEKAADDYANSFRVLLPHADFFVVNVSSPNTPNLRKLQDKAALEKIIAAMNEVQSRAEGGVLSVEEKLEIPNPKSQTPNKKPILVKVAPDLSFEALDEIVEFAMAKGVVGIVATNTTVGRPETKDEQVQSIYAEAGGLSGRPLRKRSTDVIRHLYQQSKGKLPIIGVGGVFDAADAWEKITAGASLLQIYTGVVYRGPSVVKDILRGLLDRMEEHGFKKLNEAVGINSGAQLHG